MGERAAVLQLGLQGARLGFPRTAGLEVCFSFSQASQAWRKNKMDESKHEIHSQVDAITAGTASVVNLTAGGLAAELPCVVGGGEGEHVQA